MPRLLCPQLPKAHRPVTLPEAEANHALRVLRLRDGDTVEAIDGKGHAVPAILRTQPGGGARLELAGGASLQASTGHARTGADSVVPLVLEIAVLKGEAMEWVVEKAVELGVRELVPLLTDHTVVQVGRAKGPEAFQARWQKIADQALKQCGRLESLRVAAPTALDLALKLPGPATRFWCDEKAGKGAPELGARLLGPPVYEARLLVGPEGGWSARESERLAGSGERVSLGPLILRAETAALFATSLLASALRIGRDGNRPLA